MELIRWIRQQVRKIKNYWILSGIQTGLMMCESPLKRTETCKKAAEKKKYYREPDLKKRKFNRREQMDSSKNC